MSKYHPSKRQGCDCPKCRALCEREPGWFMPEEIPSAAEFCGLTEEAFRERYLESHERDGVTMGSPKRAIGGQCIFFKDGKCRIHSVKPFECRKVFGCEADRRHRRVRDQMVRMVKTFGAK